MSYLGWKPQREYRSAWWLFPWVVVAALGFVVAVNAGMVFAALHTFPGQTGDEGYELSNHYDAVLDRAEQQASLGWRLAAGAEAATPVLTLLDRNGAAIGDATIVATAERPLGASNTQHLVFRETPDGRYVSAVALPLPGQWELTIAASAKGHDIAATRRVIVH